MDENCFYNWVIFMFICALVGIFILLIYVTNGWGLVFTLGLLIVLLVPPYLCSLWKNRKK